MPISRGDRAVDDEQRRRHVGRRLHPVEVECLFGQRQHRRAHHGGVFGLAPGHHHVDRQHLARQAAVARRHLAFDQIRVAAQRRDKPVDQRAGRRHHRQPVGPALLEIPLDQICAGGQGKDVICFRLDRLRLPRHARLPARAQNQRLDDSSFSGGRRAASPRVHGSRTNPEYRRGRALGTLYATSAARHCSASISCGRAISAGRSAAARPGYGRRDASVRRP